MLLIISKKGRNYIVLIIVILLFSSTVTSIAGDNVIKYIEYSSKGTVVTFIEKSTGLDNPEKEGGNTELELADINNDGHLDIISVGDHGSPYVNSDQHGIMVWFGDGIGTWSVSQVGDFGYGGIEAGDLNLDGYLDVVWGVHHDWGDSGFGDTLIGAALGDGTGTSWDGWATGLGTAGEDWGMFATDLADFDCNGLLDIVSQSFGCCNGYHVYENDGDGTWTHQWTNTGGNTYDNLEVGDFNSDGFPDFVGTQNGYFVYFGDGYFDFSLNQDGLPTNYWWSGLDVGDMNNDGCDDIVIGYSSGGVRCYEFNKQSEDWDLASSGLPTSGSYYPQFGDIDGDGYLDIVAYEGPTGYTYLGDGNGNWEEDATFTLPSDGDYSAFVVDGDFDHDGREDVVIQAEEGGWPTYQNHLKAFSPWLEPTELTALVQKPNGGETLRSGSIRKIRWLSGVPESQGDSTVEIQISLNGESGPWDTIVSDIPNNGCYQWLVDAGGSENCRIKIIVSTSKSSSYSISESDFSIIGFNVYANGPYNASTGETIQFTGNAENGNPPYEYHWDFGDGHTSDEQNPTHSYEDNRNYTVVLSVKDSDDITIRDSTWALISDNEAPSIPEINGPLSGKPGIEYEFKFLSTDPDGDDIYYLIDWGDGYEDVTGYYPSGTEAHALHTWAEKGTYIIKAQAVDPYEAKSDWGQLSFNVPRDKAFSNFNFLRFLNQFKNNLQILRDLLTF